MHASEPGPPLRSRQFLLTVQSQFGRFRTWFPGAFKRFAILCLKLAPLALLGVALVIWRLTANLPPVENLAKYETAQTSRILSRDGQVVATLFVQNRTPVDLKKISPHLIKALVAIEDRRFFDHGGVDWWGAGRAFVANVVFRRVDQGASTLTMQLARNRFLNQDLTFTRKIREIVLARRIESRYSKNEILQFYFNNVYFGSGAYGIASASSLYFGKPPDRLSIAQSALLVGLVQAPSSFSPLVNPDAAKKRMKTVLQRMRETGALGEADYQYAVKEGEAMRFGGGKQAAKSDPLLKHPYFTTFVIAELAKQYPEDMLYLGGLQVSTTLDINLQKAAEEELTALMAEYGPGVNADSAALVLIENETGAVRAMVGGRGWNPNNQFNRAWQAARQPGSSFKPFVYGAALVNGMTPESIVEDSPTTFGDWSPKNSDGQFRGPISLRQALLESRNVVSAKLCDALGPARVIQVAKALGIKEEIPHNLSIALGACEVSPLSMASAFSSIASGGVYRAPVALTQVTNPAGDVLIDNRNNPGSPAISPPVAAQLTDMLLGVVRSGTGTAAAVDGVDVAGKTGTTDESRDAWFVGYTPDYTMAVWVGNDDHSPMSSVYGGGLPAMIWQRVMNRVVDYGVKQARFNLPETAPATPQVLVKLCTESGLLATTGCPKTKVHQATDGDVPTETCELHAPKETATPTPQADDEEAPTPTPEITATPTVEPATPDVPVSDEPTAEPWPAVTPQPTEEQEPEPAFTAAPEPEPEPQDEAPMDVLTPVPPPAAQPPMAPPAQAPFPAGDQSYQEEPRYVDPEREMRRNERRARREQRRAQQDGGF
jgi:penicillin-binding protein 1A